MVMAAAASADRRWGRQRQRLFILVRGQYSARGFVVKLILLQQNDKT
jgi:hypothetical protein